jgi:hypothetical protein
MSELKLLELIWVLQACNNTFLIVELGDDVNIGEKCISVIRLSHLQDSRALLINLNQF